MGLPIPSLPSSLGAYSLSADGYSVTLPTTVTSEGEEWGNALYFEEIPGRDGLFPIRHPHHLGRSLSLIGVVFSSSTVDDLRKVIARGRVTISRGGRTLEAEVSDASIVPEVTNKIWRIAISLEAKAAYWSGDQVTTGSSPTTIINNGDLDAYPTFSVTAGVGGLASINFTVSGREVEWTGNASENEVIIIDCSDITAVLDGNNDLNSMNSSFFVDPIRFNPGSNTITPTINGSATYEVTFTEKFL